LNSKYNNKSKTRHNGSSSRNFNNNDNNKENLDRKKTKVSQPADSRLNQVAHSTAAVDSFRRKREDHSAPSQACFN
jgi:hypothetical protein